MRKAALALAAACLMAAPVLAQEKPAEPKKATLPANTFFKGQTTAQVLAKEKLLGAKVLDKDNQQIGTIEDLIVSGGQLEGVIIASGDKKVGVRIGALKITTTEGNASIVLPTVTKDILAAAPAYQRAHAAAKK